ncbi:NACHT domain-containing protein [Variovorax sp. PDNC026]|uniref:ATP-binding protein n=1 Tax=Variovorax sp. PDNC026 TaxID=2811425 RepID=UPI001964BCD1|nr:ATP-binding protein [Variovorax sp. PDNC026]QRY31890.1 NACHT domain-containing protein [Variovorax sp. PDNC026]
MTENIKNTAITSAGYLYQNRHGLRVLCDWLDAPTRYTRVKFECDDEAEAPMGLDDIVVERSDGRQDLQQIKFTPNPDVHVLSWDWLLGKTGKTERSRSTVRKWFDAFKEVDVARRGELSLKTNRRPDAEIEACLGGGKIVFAKVPEPKRSALIAELGSEPDCEEFFSHLQIWHSDKGFETLEREVDARLRPHGTPEGIAVLKYRALNWATQKGLPLPDGWITLAEVRAILQATPPAPLPEDFAVPKGYEVPDLGFHQAFVDEVLAAVGKALVLTGPPGRGKSTYLSALCDALADQGVPTVRHHYFLSTTERGRDRVHSHVVEESIKSQIKRFHRDVSNMGGELRAQLEACAAHYKTLNKPFVLILDGLDHVWRINAEDKRPLDDIFAQVVPCPDNMVLLVGTQPVADAQLPADLLAATPKSAWRTLPAMSGDAVLSYLRKAISEGRLDTGLEHQESAERELQGAAAALHARTKGHPLHVIYASAELVHAGGRLTTWAVARLSGELGGDAKSYYASLWERLTPSLKDSLRLICAFPFFWPRTAFGQIADAIKLAEPEVQKVEHLLHSSAAGLKVFHESLAVYVRSTGGYGERVAELMPEVALWLETLAPPALRVNWLWTVQAKLGDPANLIAGLTRDWVMLRLEEGYPESLFETLLIDAMVAALDTSRFADAFRLQHLKARMVDGSQFQMQEDDMARLVSFTLALAADASVVREAVSSRHETDILRVAALGLALRGRGEYVVARACGDEALRRFQGASRFSSEYRSSNGRDSFRFLADAFVRLGAVGSTAEERVRLVSKNHLDVWLPLIRLLVEEGELDELMALAASLSAGKRKNIVSDACVRAAAHAGASVVDRGDFASLARTPLVAAVEAAHTRAFKPLSAAIPINWLSSDYDQRKRDLATLMHHWFFSAVHLGLCTAAEGQTEFNYVRAPIYDGRENITDFLDALTGVASQVAHHWWRGEFVDFHELYELLDPVEFRPFRQSHDRQWAADEFRAALHQIACDIHLGSVLLDGRDDIDLTEETMAAAVTYKWFDSVSFREQYFRAGFPRMSDDATAAFVQGQRVLLEAEVREETSVYLQTPLQLCGIALAHGLTVQARELCRQTWELVTGYSHRKDPTLGNAVDAIAYLVEGAPAEAQRLLAQLGPQIQAVMEYTDGKGTRHVLAETDTLLARLKPSALVRKYEEHTDRGRWALAENSLNAYVEQGVRAGWLMDALMRTGLHSEIGDKLEQLARGGVAGAAERMQILTEHAGWDIGRLRQRDRDTDTENSSSKPLDVDVAAFEPEQSGELMEQTALAYDERRTVLRAWFQYWADKGEGQRLLNALDSSLLSEEGRTRDLLVLSDLAFHTRRKLSGPKAAWKYLVQAQINSGGWTAFMESAQKTCARLDLVAQFYPKRCDEFVIATTYGPFPDPERPRVAPDETMVYFYIKQGRLANAVHFAETMVDCVIDDTRTLPLPTPRWAAELAAAADGAN